MRVEVIASCFVERVLGDSRVNRSTRPIRGRPSLGVCSLLCAVVSVDVTVTVLEVVDDAQQEKECSKAPRDPGQPFDCLQQTALEIQAAAPCETPPPTL